MKRSFLAVLAILFLVLPVLGQQKVTQPFTITILATPISITTPTTAVPNAISTQVYPAIQFAAAGGVAPYTWSTVGTPPPGLSITAGGSFGGTPSATGTFTFGVQVKDSQATPGIAAQQYTIVVASPLAITTTTLPSGTINTPYSQPVAVSGGIAPYSCSATGSLPGLTVTGGANGCTIAGTPSTAGNFPIALTVTDSGVGNFARLATAPRIYALVFTVKK